MYSSFPPPGGTTPTTTGGSYPGGQYPPGSYPGGTYYPPVITGTDVTALRKFFSLRWGEYPKALPPMLPYTTDQVKAMFAKNPGVRATVEGHVRAQGHAKLFLGHNPTAEDYADPNLFAALALWFANGTGDDLSRGEDMIRNLIMSGMDSLGGSSGGGGVTVDIGGSTLTAGLPLLLAVGLGLFFLTRPTT